uniref:Uncharacterized protein n=1 Tax=Arundo donax TaxID=35708 RepID=A0A0A9CM47_ARUDO
MHPCGLSIYTAIVLNSLPLTSHLICLAGGARRRLWRYSSRSLKKTGGADLDSVGKLSIGTGNRWRRALRISHELCSSGHILEMARQ